MINEVKEIEHIGYVFRAIDASIPYHDLTKSILDNPPEGYKIVERPVQPNNGTANAVREYIKRLHEIVKQNFGIGDKDFNEFIATRDFEEMSRIPLDRNIWVTTIPYYIGPNNWLLECEDWGTLCYPFIGNNHNCLGDVQNHFAVKILRTQFEMDNFLGIVTHIKSTVDSIRGVFGDKVANKTYYVPIGYDVPEATPNKIVEDDTFNLLFHGSFNHTDLHFFLRGGLELVAAFKEAYKVNKNLLLTVIYDRKGMVRIPKDVVEELDSHPGIVYIDRRVTKKELFTELEYCHATCIPAYRIHSQSTLQSLMNYRPVICSDGWGFDEFVQDGINGYIAEGNESSWTDEHGIMREQYKTGNISKKLVESLTATFLKISRDKKKYDELAENARSSVEVYNSIDNRNKMLGKVFNKVF